MGREEPGELQSVGSQIVGHHLATRQQTIPVKKENQKESTLNKEQMTACVHHSYQGTAWVVHGAEHHSAAAKCHADSVHRPHCADETEEQEVPGSWRPAGKREN